MQAELCLFDLDGTLLDTQNDYLAADRYMRGVYELEPLPMKVAVQLASAGLRAVIKAAFLNTHGKMPADELVEEAYQLNIKYYMEHIADHAHKNGRNCGKAHTQGDGDRTAQLDQRHHRHQKYDQTML